VNDLLEVRELRTIFTTDDGEFAAVDGVSFSIGAGRTLAIVGESGCGKSVTAPVHHGAGAQSTRPHGRRIDPLRRPRAGGRPCPAEMQDLRGNGMAMIFQEPMSSLNPAFTIGDQIMESLLRHDLTRAQARERASRCCARCASRRRSSALTSTRTSSVRRHAPARHDRHGAGL
jgi:peptide/nickel transport system ATP-binding protein